MEKIVAKIISVSAGSNDELSNEERTSIRLELDGVVGDRHQSFERKTCSGDKQPKGTIRRNERQWSAVSVEELDEVQEAMDLVEPIRPSSISANLCLSGVAELSPIAERHNADVCIRRWY